MNPILEIFSQGEEIIRGQITDTNATWLSQQTVELGFDVSRHTAVGDKLDDLATLLQEIALRADCCLCTGGLGPTSDDLTAEAVAKAFNLPLVFDELAYAQIQRYFANRGRTMPETNRKQAMLPEGAIRLDNTQGTAPGFALKYRRCWFAFMPGVPSEMRAMYRDKIVPEFSRRFALRPGRLITLKTIGLGESALQERIATITWPNDVQLGFRAAEDVQLKLLFPNDYPETVLDGLVDTVTARLGSYVYAIDGLGRATGDLMATVDNLMVSGGHSLAVLETVSQGLLAAKCVGTDWLLAAQYGQSLSRIKTSFGLDSAESDLLAIAKSIAHQLQQQHNTDCALVQLNSDEGNALNDKDKPVEVLSLLLAGHSYQHERHTMGGTVQRKQQQAAIMSLDMLRRYFQPIQAVRTK